MILTADKVIEIGNSFLEKASDVSTGLLSFSKTLAVVFILVYWVNNLIKSMDKTGESLIKSIKPSSVIYAILYVVLILKANVILDYIENLGMSYYEASKLNLDTKSMYEAFEESNIAEDTIREAASGDTGFFDQLMTEFKVITEWIDDFADPVMWVLNIAKGISWLVNAVILPVFLFERAFVLSMLNLMLPIALAFAPFKAMRPSLETLFKTYFAIYLSLIPIMLASSFCDFVYYEMVQALNLEDYNSFLNAKDLSVVVVFVIVVSLKAKLYPKASEILLNLFVR